MKRYFITAIILSLLITCLFSFAACSKKQEPEEERVGLEKNVSTYHDAVYVGGNEDFTLQLFAGESEKLIAIDGKVGELTSFATLTVTPLSSALFNNTYTYTVTGEKGVRSGDLIKDVIGATFSAELNDLDDLGTLTSVKITAADILESDIPLTNKLEGALGWKDVLKIAEAELADEIKTESDTGALEREIYIKLVNAMPDDDAPYYYYVSFIKSPADYWALLLDPVKGEVISKKV